MGGDDLERRAEAEMGTKQEIQHGKQHGKQHGMQHSKQHLSLIHI